MHRSVATISLSARPAPPYSLPRLPFSFAAPPGELGRELRVNGSRALRYNAGFRNNVITLVMVYFKIWLFWPVRLYTTNLDARHSRSIGRPAIPLAAC